MNGTMASCRATDPETPAARELAHRLATEPPFHLGNDHPLLTEAHQILLRRATARPPAVTPGEGRGIVQAVGGSLYFRCAWASVSVLRDAGCELPIEWWHLGPSEMDPRMIEVAASLGVRCVDAHEVARTLPGGMPRILNGWELKSFAVAHSSFQEVLFLDADNIPAADPTFLFDHPEYQKHGAIFWPDLPPWDRAEWLPDIVWRNLGLEPRNEIDFESGQLLIDKGRCSRELGVTLHINDHSDWYYKFVYGDKSTFHLGWRVCGSDYAMPTKGAGWIHPAIQQYDFDGNILFQHVCQGKDNLAGGRRLPGVEYRETVRAAAAILAGIWDGDIWSWKHQTEEETTFGLSVAGKWRYHRLDLGEGPRDITLGPNGTIPEGGGGCEQRWTARLVGPDKVPTIIIVGSAHKGTLVGMMFLTEGRDGVWRGRWTAHERCRVEFSNPGAPGTDLGWATGSRWQLEQECRDKVRTKVLPDAPGVAECRIFGDRWTICAPLSDTSLTPHMIIHGYWEGWVTTALARMLRSGWHCVDVGANIGYYTVLFAAGAGPTGRVMAVEPQMNLANLLKKTIQINGFSATEVIGCAAGRADGELALTVPCGNTCNASGYVPTEGTVVTVQVRPLDSLLADWPRVDLIKIDAEGAEPEVWAGMQGVVRRHRPVVVLEFNAGRYADPVSFLDSLSGGGREVRVIRTDAEITPISRDEILGKGSEHMLVVQ